MGEYYRNNETVFPETCVTVADHVTKKMLAQKAYAGNNIPLHFFTSTFAVCRHLSALV